MSMLMGPVRYARRVLARRQRADAPPASSIDSSIDSRPPGAQAHEDLERIATYARAGYFNMGYTFDMFPLVGDLPPH